MLLRIEHSTDLTYSDLISESAMELRMAPRQEQDQSRLSFSLSIGPATQVASYFDWLGNSVHHFTINALHRQLRIVGVSVVRTDRILHDPKLLPDCYPHPAGDYQAYDFVAFGGPVTDSPALRELVASVGALSGLPLGEIGVRVMERINGGFEYRQGLTTAASPVCDVLAKRAGVCQDFTHLMIAICRALGIPARYVSGLVHPPDGDFRGNTQTHAWCELHFPSVGWVGFDPTNNCTVGENFIKVAHGRDYRDVAPNRGVWKGTAFETIHVGVRSEQLFTIPAELAAERMQALSVPTYPPGFSLSREAYDQQPPVQQQQQQQQQ